MQKLINKRLVERRFSQNAKWYDEVTPLQSSMAKKLIASVGEHTSIHKTKSILELGCGTGKLTRLLLHHFPNSKITAIDISSEMIRRLKQNIVTDPRVHLVVGDAETLIDEGLLNSGKFELIISNTTVQWFNRPLTTISKYQSLLSREGTLAFSTFGPDTFFELREAFVVAEKRLGLAHRAHILSFVSPEEWEKAFVQQGKDGVFSVKEDRRLEAFVSVKDFLYSVKKVGAASPYSRGCSFMGPNLYKYMVKEYEKRNTIDGSGKIKATFHMVYVLASSKTDFFTR